jgi:hypothetical protein
MEMKQETGNRKQETGNGQVMTIATGELFGGVIGMVIASLLLSFSFFTLHSPQISPIHIV